MWTGKSTWLLAAVLVSAIGLRVAALWVFRAELSKDHDNYRRLAEQVVSGHGYSNPQTGQPTAYRPPLYPLLLAAMLRCGGSDAAIGLAQAILGLATVVITIDAGRRLGLGRGSLVAGALVAADPLLLSLTPQIMTETTAAFLAALLVWLCVHPASSLTSLLTGVVFGAACLCRPTFWAFGILAGLVQVWTMNWRAGLGDPAIRRALATIAGAALVIAPWGIRNSQTMGKLIITTTHGGYTLLLAHNPAYTRAVVEQPWGTVWNAASFEEWSKSLEAELAAQSPPIDAAHLSSTVELARDDWMNRTARKSARIDPVTAVRSGLTLLYRMWSIVPAAIEGESRSAAMRLAIGTFYAPVLLAMLAGVVWFLRRNWRSGWPLVALIVSFSAVHSLYWADMRMRSPLVPAIALLAAAGCRWWKGNR